MQPMIELVFSPAALRKLDSIYNYLQAILDDPGMAAARITSLLDSLGTLKQNPEIGPRLSSRINEVPERFAETRFLVRQDYITIYDYLDETVQVLAIYHCREDAFGRFFSEVG